MKAACVLVCLALAHGITASIFKQQQREVDGLDVQQLENIDQYQQLHRDQTVEVQNKRDQTLQDQKQQDQTLQDQKQRDQTLQDQKQWDKTLQSQKYHGKQLQNPKYRNQQVTKQTYLDQEQLTQGSMYQQNLPSYQEQYQQSAVSNSQEWPSTHQQSHSRNHHDKKHHHSSSSESSQESKEWRNNGNQKWNRDERVARQMIFWPRFSTLMKQDNLPTSQVYGDVIEWNGLKMAVGPNSLVQTPEDIESIFSDAQKAMKHIPKEEKVKIDQAYAAAAQVVNEDALLNATELARKYQYVIEEHTIKTDDGYLLTVFRIPSKKQIPEDVKAPVVFLMHDILGSADDWLLMGPGQALAYLLADAGYDVWLGNARGNKYSKRHVSRYPAMADFWQFSTDEIALHDLPTMIDFVLETTKQEKLSYIGHGMGTTVLFALLATRPEYNDKIIMTYALSPMVYMTNVRSPALKMMSPTSRIPLHRMMGNEAFNPSKELVNTAGGAMCEIDFGRHPVCSNMNFVMSGVNLDGMDSNFIPVVMGHMPAGTSVKVMNQFGQAVASQEFRRYDYGPFINEQVYGTLEAPEYNITEIQAPVTLYYSQEDWLAHPIDVARLQKELPNVKESYRVPDVHFSHMDFQLSNKAPVLVYKRIIDSLKNQL